MCATAIFFIEQIYTAFISLKMGSTECSPSDKIPNGIFLQAGLAVFAFRFAQTHTTLRLSHPAAHKAVYALLPFLIEQIHTAFISLKMGSTGFEPVAFRV